MAVLEVHSVPRKNPVMQNFVKCSFECQGGLKHSFLWYYSKKNRTRIDQIWKVVRFCTVHEGKDEKEMDQNGDIG